MIKLSCEKCGSEYNIPDDTAWKTWKCKCWEKLLIPNLQSEIKNSHNQNNTIDKVAEFYYWANTWLVFYIIFAAVCYWLSMWFSQKNWIFIDIISIIVVVIITKKYKENNYQYFIFWFVITFLILITIMHNETGYY